MRQHITHDYGEHHGVYVGPRRLLLTVVHASKSETIASCHDELVNACLCN
jgi:hypothetical protein